MHGREIHDAAKVWDFECQLVKWEDRRRYKLYCCEPKESSCSILFSVLSTGFLPLVWFQLTLTCLYCFLVSHIIFIFSPTLLLCFDSMPVLNQWGDVSLNCTRRNLCLHIVQLSPTSHSCFFIGSIQLVLLLVSPPSSTLLFPSLYLLFINFAHYLTLET